MISNVCVFNIWGACLAVRLHPLRSPASRGVCGLAQLGPLPDAEIHLDAVHFHAAGSIWGALVPLKMLPLEMRWPSFMYSSSPCLKPCLQTWGRAPRGRRCM